MELKDSFDVVLCVPQLGTKDEAKEVFNGAGFLIEDLNKIVEKLPLPISIKPLLMVIRMAHRKAAENYSLGLMGNMEESEEDEIKKKNFIKNYCTRRIWCGKNLFTCTLCG